MKIYDLRQRLTSFHQQSQKPHIFFPHFKSASSSSSLFSSLFLTKIRPPSTPPIVRTLPFSFLILNLHFIILIILIAIPNLRPSTIYTTRTPYPPSIPPSLLPSSQVDPHSNDLHVPS
ncbi:hypothetical protein E2C01_087020 [Portunus trituberculatus]|uniref:Transmembrane protein n=1 Tax=Portunus trituberculatus TaxID=210409 RepID=A0A5B7JHY7_PORTR|nr:hypothetical protein [Portunus trituberculatus]